MLSLLDDYFVNKNVVIELTSITVCRQHTSILGKDVTTVPVFPWKSG